MLTVARPKALVPSIHHFTVVAPTIPGAPRQLWAPLRIAKPWMFMPATWRNSRNEWIVWWYLTTQRKMRPGRDFLYQSALTAPGLFASRLFTRADFVILSRGRAVAHRGIVIDPETPFTHKYPWLDARKRSILGLAGWRVVFVDGAHLERDPGWVIELALRGQDVSIRGARFP